MKPTPTREKIFHKLTSEKTELNATKYLTQYIQGGQRTIALLEEVESDLKIVQNQVDDRKNLLDEAVDELKSLQEDKLSYKRDGNNIISELNRDLKKIEKASKELGMQQNELTPKYSQAKDIYNKLGKAVTKI